MGLAEMAGIPRERMSILGGKIDYPPPMSGSFGHAVMMYEDPNGVVKILDMNLPEVVDLRWQSSGKAHFDNQGKNLATLAPLLRFNSHQTWIREGSEYDKVINPIKPEDMQVLSNEAIKDWLQKQNTEPAIVAQKSASAVSAPGQLQ